MYGKVFASLWDGSLGNSWASWSTFVFIIANCNRDGVLEMTPEAISRRSCIPLADVEAALELLMHPDPRSRSQAEEGRRIVPLDERGWGWQIVNYQHYRGLRDERERMQQNRDAQQRHRSQPPSATVSRGQPRSAQADVDVEVEAEVEAEGNSKETHNPESPPATRAGLSRWWTGQFHSRFWPLVWAKVSKQDALAEWTAIEGKSTELLEVILAAVPAAAEHQRMRRDRGDEVLHPHRWLKKRRWEDEGLPVGRTESMKAVLAAWAASDDVVTGGCNDES